MEPPKTSVDPTKINGPYPLLALLLLVMEGLLGFWLFKAEGPVERCVAGILMTVDLAGIIFAVVKIVEQPKPAPMRASGLPDEITPAHTEATAAEIKAPDSDAMAATDGSYLISKTPDGWTVRDLTLEEWTRECMGIPASDGNAKPAAATELRNVRVFQSPRVLSAIPTPGKTKLDGRAFPTALEIPMPTQLSIQPIERFQPPFFIERSLTQNFISVIGGITNMGLSTLDKYFTGIVPGSKRNFEQAEFHQKIEDVTLNGQDGQSITANTTVIGIEGNLCDFVLVMNYPSGPAIQAETSAQVHILQDLVNSFRPLKFPNPEQMQVQLRQRADQKLSAFLKQSGPEIFSREFRVILLRYKTLNLEKPKDRLKVIDSLKPFEALARNLGLQDDDQLAALWAALHKADSGDATDLISILKTIIAAVVESERQQALAGPDASTAPNAVAAIQ